MIDNPMDIVYAIQRSCRDIHYNIRNVISRVKHGHDSWAPWNISTWFITYMGKLLRHYRKHHVGVAIVIDNYPYYGDDNDPEVQRLIKLNDDTWNEIIDKMIFYLDAMDENNYDASQGNYTEINKQMDEAKEEFFILFTKYFYHLWD